MLTGDRMHLVSTMAERFEEAVKATGLERAEIERKVSGKAGGHLTHVIAGRRTKLSHSMLVKYARALGVSETWLATGEGARSAVPEPGQARPSDEGRWRDFADLHIEFRSLARKMRAHAEPGRELRLVDAALDEASDRLRNYGGGELSAADAKRAYREAWAFVNDEEPPAPKVSTPKATDTTAKSSEELDAKADAFSAKLAATKKKS
jgi:transcriptional regulator with XRE-family HTH domain